MNQTSNLLNTLKRYLKAKGTTYRQLGHAMGLSEASIKRLFSKESLSVKRLEEICRIVDINFYDLVMMSRRDSQRLSNTLSFDQEKALAEDPVLLSFFYFLLNGWELNEIYSKYDITEKEAFGFLRKLDKLRLIEWHSGDRIRILVSKNIFWEKDGQISKKYRRHIQSDFFNYPFDQPNERSIFGPGFFSENSLKILHQKIDDLARLFDELVEIDSVLPAGVRYPAGIVIGFRPWVFSVISNLRQHKKKKDKYVHSED